MKALFTFFLIVTVFSVSAQEGVIVKYYDSLWKPTSKEKATYYTHFIKADTLYKCTSYYAKSNKLYGRSTYADTLFTKGKARGKMLLYYENGSLKDSTIFNNSGRINSKYEYFENGNCKKVKDTVLGLGTTYRSYYSNGGIRDSSLYSIQGQPIYTYSFFESKKLMSKTVYGKDKYEFQANVYFENGNLRVHAHWDKEKKMSIGEGYDSLGNLIPNYIYQKEAEFPGGSSEWVRYLQRNLNSALPSENGAPSGKYTVTIGFIVDKEGNVSDVYSENDPGYGCKEEAIRVIQKGPSWIPAIQLNKPVSYRARQQITFVVANK